MRLYIILFLHQTTTSMLCGWLCWRCISSFSYIKPQPLHRSGGIDHSCISSFSYIKPQQQLRDDAMHRSCISSFSYIKPQPLSSLEMSISVVYHPFPTSNHNSKQCLSLCYKLYIILFLHQTTTMILLVTHAITLYIILFLHQTTT